MTVGDWGVDEKPSTDAPGEGWEEAPEAPMWVWLPAVWPAQHRLWIPGSTAWTTTGGQPWDEDDAEFEASVNADLGSVGVPHRPEGRRWFLELPDGHERLDPLLESFVREVESKGYEAILGVPAFPRIVEREIAHLAWGDDEPNDGGPITDDRSAGGIDY